MNTIYVVGFEIFAGKKVNGIVRINEYTILVIEFAAPGWAINPPIKSATIDIPDLLITR